LAPQGERPNTGIDDELQRSPASLISSLRVFL
jgi:hypothetical protein